MNKITGILLVCDSNPHNLCKFRAVSYQLDHQACPVARGKVKRLNFYFSSLEQAQTLQLDFLMKILPNYHHLKKSTRPKNPEKWKAKRIRDRWGVSGVQKERFKGGPLFENFRSCYLFRLEFLLNFIFFLHFRFFVRKCWSFFFAVHYGQVYFSFVAINCFESWGKVKRSTMCGWNDPPRVDVRSTTCGWKDPLRVDELIHSASINVLIEVPSNAWGPRTFV